MSTSQNGWQGIESGSDERLVRIPKIIGRVRGGDVAVILTDLVDQFDAHVEDVDLGADDWGHAYRDVREGASLSNHASGTAIDLNATRHPLGKVGTFTATQVAALRKILARYGGVIRWGGDYSGRKDEMHFEINANAAAVASVAARLRAGHGGAAITPPTSEEDDMPLTDADIQKIWGYRNAKVERDDAYAILRAARDASTKTTALDKKLSGVVIDARDGVLGNRAITAQIAGLQVAVEALATGRGLDPKAITAAVDAGVKSALARVETTVTVKPEGGR